MQFVFDDSGVRPVNFGIKETDLVEVAVAKRIIDPVNRDVLSELEDAMTKYLLPAVPQMISANVSLYDVFSNGE